MSFFFINILKFMDERTFITCIYTVTASVYSSVQMNKDNLTLNNDIRCEFLLSGQSSSWQNSAEYLILNFSNILKST